jgi:hypothetical protein
MSFTISDVNKEVCYRDPARHGHYKGRLVAISADHQTAFVEWFHLTPPRNRRTVAAICLCMVQEAYARQRVTCACGWKGTRAELKGSGKFAPCPKCESVHGLFVTSFND